jgi:DnaJ-class molecular chaperone
MNDTERRAADEAKAGENPGGKRAVDQRRKCRACFGKGWGFRPGSSEKETCDKCGGAGTVVDDRPTVGELLEFARFEREAGDR